MNTEKQEVNVPILYQGTRKSDGRSITGTAMVDVKSGKTFILPQRLGFYYCDTKTAEDCCEVHRSSIGFYIGKNDDKGKPIFVGDAISATLCDKSTAAKKIIVKGNIKYSAKLYVVYFHTLECGNVLLAGDTRFVVTGISKID